MSPPLSGQAASPSPLTPCEERGEEDLQVFQGGTEPRRGKRRARAQRSHCAPQPRTVRGRRLQPEKLRARTPRRSLAAAPRARRAHRQQCRAPRRPLAAARRAGQSASRPRPCGAAQNPALERRAEAEAVPADPGKVPGGSRRSQAGGRVGARLAKDPVLGRASRGSLCRLKVSQARRTAQWWTVRADGLTTEEVGGRARVPSPATTWSISASIAAPAAPGRFPRSPDRDTRDVWDAAVASLFGAPRMHRRSGSGTFHRWCHL